METTLPTDPTTDPAQLLEVLQLQTHQVWACKRQNNPTALEQPLDTLLSLLEDIIQQSYDRYVALEGEEKSAMQAYHVKQASQMVYPLLVKIVSGEVTDNARVDRTAKVLSHLSGRGAAGAMIGTWHFSCLDSHGKETVVSLKIHEPSYIGNDIGFKTWGAAPLMAKRLVQKPFIPPHQRILELGTGTGMVGLMCEKLGAASVELTDYHPSVLENVAINVELNQATHATVAQLDFIDVATNPESPWRNHTYDIVIASDLLYEMEHAKYLPVAVEALMTDTFYFMIPLRSTHVEEVTLFESRMVSLGLYLKATDDEEVQEEEGITLYRFYYYSRQ